MAHTVGWRGGRSVRWSLVLVLLMLTVLRVPPGARAAGGTCSVGGGAGYATLQAAVADAGCATITVAAGTYQENVTIARAVTISGAGAGSTVVDGGWKPQLTSGDTCFQRDFYCSVFIISQPVDVTFSGLTIRHGYNTHDRAGGIQVDAGANVTVQDSSVSDNHAVPSGAYRGFGGAITFQQASGSLTVRNSTVSGNTPAGAIYFRGASLTVLTSTFSANGGPDTFGGAITTLAPSTITSSTFSGNQGHGGALSATNQTTVVNSTFVDNRADGKQGGAIWVGNLGYCSPYCVGGSVTVSSSTVSGNSAARGGGIYVDTGRVTLRSTLLANNTNENCSSYMASGAPFVDGGSNLRWPSSDTSCFGSYGDPRLAALADNGGATQTLALQAGSAAVEAGSCTDVSGTSVTTDQRGVARPVDGDSNGTAACDVGAYEAPAGTNPTPSPAPTPIPPPPTPTPIARIRGLDAHWKFDEGTGTVATDSSGNGHTGTLKNGAAFTSSVLGVPRLSVANPFALALTGAKHQYVDLGTNWAMGQYFTVAAWAKRSSTAGKQWIVSGGTRTTGRALVLGFRDNDHFTCAFYNNDLDTPSAYTDTGAWHHWACTYDSSKNERKLYRDGVLVASDWSLPPRVTGAVNLGRAVWDEAYFTGALDDVRFYFTPLTAAEVQQIAAGQP